MGFKAQLEWTGSVRCTVGTNVSVSRFGEGPTPRSLLLLGDGAGVNQANCCHERPFALKPGEVLAVDLHGANGELDVNNLPLALAAVKGVVVILTPAGGGKGLPAGPVLLGPQGHEGAAQLWFGGVAGSDRAEVRTRFANEDPVAGWAVAVGKSTLPISNPGAVPVTGWLRVYGVRPPETK